MTKGILVCCVCVVGFVSMRSVDSQGKPPTSAAPACKFLKPKMNELITGNSVQVLVEATDDHDIKNAQFFVNGVPVPPQTARPISAEAKPISADAKDIPPGHKVSRMITALIPLPPNEKDIVIRARVTDADNNPGEAKVVVQQAAGSGIGDLYVLCVGVSRYRNPRYNFETAARDADAVAAAFAAQQGKQYARVHGTLLTNEKATLPALREALRSLKSARPADTVVVFLAGHAVLGRQSEAAAAFAPYAFVVNDVEGTCLPWQETVGTLAGIFAKKFLFVDACQAGARLGVRQAAPEHLSSAARETGIVMMAATTGGEFGYADPASGRGAFAVALVEALNGSADANRDGSVTLPELEIFVPRRVSDLTGGKQHPHLASVQDFNPQTALARLR